MIAKLEGPVFAVQNPFHISFGNRTHIVKNFFSNNGCIIYDHGGVKIGDNVMLGPNVIITSISHAMDVKERAFLNIRIVLNRIKELIKKYVLLSISETMYGLWREPLYVRVLKLVIILLSEQEVLLLLAFQRMYLHVVFHAV